jgi:hypothetical protein
MRINDPDSPYFLGFGTLPTFYIDSNTAKCGFAYANKSKLNVATAWV